MNLRPHHLLCIQKYTGHGYDAHFTRHMTSLVSELAENPQIPVRIVRECDDLCHKCPHNVNGVCTSSEKVTSIDQAVLGACSLAYGEIAPWEELANQARTQIFETEEFRNTCSCCQWFELCRATEVYHESDKSF